METMSHVLDEAYELLRADLCTYLDETEYVSEFVQWSDNEKELVRRSIRDLVTVIRALVVEHEHDPAGNCKKCATPWPCPVTESIHRLIKAPTQVFNEILDHVHNLEPRVVRG